MRRMQLASMGLALVLALSGCFFPVSERHRFHDDHRDRHTVILEDEPAPDRDCWRHDHHWHCRDSD